jgi:vitamin-K-epoxide reductase (warfarin-sensitive)
MRAAVSEIRSALSLGQTKSLRMLFLAIVLLSLAGMVVSGVSLTRHYAKSATTYCDVGEKFNCDIVNRSEYSTVMDIPVAAIGMAGYALLFTLSTFLHSRSETSSWLLLASLAGLSFALYLTYIEAYKLETWCILCLSSQFLIAAIAGLSLTIKIKTPARNKRN